MKSRIRVKNVLEHKIPDRIPIDLGGVAQTSIHINPYRKLKEYYGLPTNSIKIFDTTQQIVFVEDDILKIFGADFKPILIKPPSYWKLDIKKEVKKEKEYFYYIDEWGTKMMMPKVNGYYYDFDKMPLEGLELDEIKKYKFPDPTDSGRYNGIKQKTQELFEKTDYSLVGSPIFGGGIFEQSARIRGLENFLIDTVSNIKIADYLYSRITEIYIESTKKFLKEVGEYVDVVAYWDDIAYQTGSIISMEHYRKYIKPRQKDYFNCIKKYSNAKIYYHSCGSIYDFISDLIEIGVDILNPIQISATSMSDAKKLKREFGNNLIFWGGAVDPQGVLPFGTKYKVEEEVKRRISELGDGGGYIFASIHNIQPGVPIENIVAMFETILRYGKY